MNNNETNGKKSDKTKETISNVLKKTSEASKKAAKVLSEKVKQDSHDRKIKKYKPLFLKEFKSKNFNIPNIIKIVDDAVRRDIDVCEGAIGWTKVVKGTEVLYLYDEAVQASGIEFIPNVGCDQLYYVDHFDRKRFIKVDCIFERAHSEKLAELERIAFSLGAKSCLIEIDESNLDSFEQTKRANTNNTTKKSVQAKKSELSTKSDIDFTRKAETVTTQKNTRSGTTRINFDGSNTPTRPTLKWFANDDIIKNLIEMRCNGNNSVRSRILTLEGSTSATMSQSIAYTIDYILASEAKLNAPKVTASQINKSTVSLTTKAIKESNSRLIFELEF
ncbi:MAG: hypothetical protein IJV72_05590 [Clostridia bacterium]|nr:hypothetical protein [Clostridia bacterium]